MTGKLIVIGLTGSIGMGKSTTAKMFIRADIPLFDSDEVVHMLLAKSGAAVELVEKTFPGVIGPDGIDRLLLGKKVFGNEAALKKLEAIIHPMVSDQRLIFFDQARKAGSDMVVMDVPLLFETGADGQCDYTVVVSAPLDIQRQRVLARSGMTEQKYTEIIARQMPDCEKRQRADFIVQSDHSFDHAESQVNQIIKAIRKKRDA